MTENEKRVPKLKSNEDRKKYRGKKWLREEKQKACLTLASCSIELQFDTQTSMVSEHVSWVKWVQIPPRQTEMYMISVCVVKWNEIIHVLSNFSEAVFQQTKETIPYVNCNSETERCMKITRQKLFHKYSSPLMHILKAF